MNSQQEPSNISSKGLFQHNFKEKHQIQRLKKNKKKCFWTLQQDKLLRDLVERYGSKQWSKISRKLKNRQPKRCRQRWFNYLASQNKDNQKNEDDQWSLFLCYKYFGNKWSSIGKLLKKGDIIVKNKINTLKRNRQKFQKLQKKMKQIMLKIRSKFISDQLPSFDKLDKQKIKQKLIFEILTQTLNIKQAQLTDGSVKLEQDIQINQRQTLNIPDIRTVDQFNYNMLLDEIQNQRRQYQSLQNQSVRFLQAQENQKMKKFSQKQKLFLTSSLQNLQSPALQSKVIQKTQQIAFIQSQNPYWSNIYSYPYAIGLKFWFFQQ